jgi:UDP-3-O-[3-hydroxymyristoyl] glucosamine N-acyltransferase
MNKIALKKLTKKLSDMGISFYYYGSNDVKLEKIVSFKDFGPETLSFYRGHDYKVLEKISCSEGLLIVRDELLDLAVDNKLNLNLLFVQDPDLAVCVLGNLFQMRPASGIHQSAVVDNAASIHPTCHIAAHVVIGENVTIGKNVLIEEGAVLKNCFIGDGTHIFPGVRIGSVGLGSSRDERGAWHHFPHFGRVVIGKNVVIQDNSTIARGSLNDTTLSDGVIVGPLTWIAHGVTLAENVFIGQSVTIAGSVSVGEGSVIWSNASLRDRIKVGKGCTIGMGSVVLRDVSDNSLVIGNPAKQK